MIKALSVFPNINTVGVIRLGIRYRVYYIFIFYISVV